MIRVLYWTILVFLVGKREGRLTRTEVKGSIIGGYKMTLFLGDPKVGSKNITLDTGSPLTIVPCRDCVNCVGSSLSQTFYDPETSFTSHKPKCVQMYGCSRKIYQFAKIGASQTRSFANSDLHTWRGPRSTGPSLNKKYISMRILKIPSGAILDAYLFRTRCTEVKE